MHQAYFQFLYNALSPSTSMADEIFCQNHVAILRTAKMLSQASQFQDANIDLFRGILTDPNNVKNGRLDDCPTMQYLSFTVDCDVAINIFANPSNLMGSFVINQTPNAQGFLITSNTANEFTLFDYRWFKEFNFMRHFQSFDAYRLSELVDEQKEVMVVNRHINYPVSDLSFNQPAAIRYY